MARPRAVVPDSLLKLAAAFRAWLSDELAHWGAGDDDDPVLPEPAPE